MIENTKIDQDHKRYKKQLKRVTLEFNEGHLKEFYTSLFEKSSLCLFHITMVFKLLILAGVLVAQILQVSNYPGIIISSCSLIILLSFWIFGAKCKKQLQTIFRICHILTSTVVYVLIMQLAEGNITFTTLGISSKNSNELASFLSIIFSLYQMVYVSIEVKWFFKAFLLFFVILLNIIFLGLDVSSSIIGATIFVFILVLLYQLEIVKKESYFEVYRIFEDFQSLKTLINDILPMQVFVVQRNKNDQEEAAFIQQQQQWQCLQKQQQKMQLYEQQQPQKVSQKGKVLEDNLQTVSKDIDTQERKENPDEIFKLKNISRNFTNITGNSMQDGFFRTKTIDINTSCRQNEKEDTDIGNHMNISKINNNNNSGYPLILNKERTSILDCKRHSSSKFQVKQPCDQENNLQDNSNKTSQNGSTLKIAFANKLIHQDFRSDNLDEMLAQLNNIQLPFPNEEQLNKNQHFQINKKQGNIYFSLLDVLRSKLQSEQSGKQPLKLPVQQQNEYKKKELLSTSQPVKTLQQQLGTMKKQSMFLQQHKKEMLKMENSCKISNPQSSQRQENLSAQGKEAQNEDSEIHSIQCGGVQSPQDQNHIVLDLPSLNQNPEMNNISQQNQIQLSHQKIIIHSDSALRNSSQAMFPQKSSEQNQCDNLNPKRKLPLFFSKRINEFTGHDSSPALMSHPKNQPQPRTVPLTAFDSEIKPNLLNYPSNDGINKVQEFQSCLYKRKKSNKSTDENDLEEKNYDIKLVECRWEGEDSVMVIMTNINERLMRERLLQIEQYKDSVIDIISHNLKTPLNCILAPLESVNSQLLSEKSQQPNSQQAEPNQQCESVKQVSMAINNCQLLLYMINDMIDYSQIIKGDNTFKLDLDHFKINYVVKVLKTLFEDQMHSKKIDFKIASSLDRSESILFHDQRRLLQVLVNLISNSLKFTLKGTVQLFIDSIVPQEDIHSHHHHHKHKLQSYYSLNNDNSTSGIHGQVMPSQQHHLNQNESMNYQTQILKDTQIPIIGFDNTIKGNATKKSKLQDKQIRFTLVDTGIGMSKEKLGRLRTMLLKRDNSLRITNSSGLGLTMCHSLIQRICCPNSYLEIESEENVGTKFTFTIQQFYPSNLALFCPQNSSQPRISSHHGFLPHELPNNQSPKYLKSMFPSVPSLLFKQNHQKQQLQLENSQFSDKRGKQERNMSYLSAKLQEAQTPSNSVSKESAFAQNSGADIINLPYLTCQPKYTNFKQQSISQVLTENQRQHEKEIIFDSSADEEQPSKQNTNNHKDRNIHRQGTGLIQNELVPSENGLLEQKQSFLMYQMHIPSQSQQMQQYSKQNSIKNVTPQNQHSQSQLQWLKRDNTINELGSFYSSITQRHTILFGGQSDKQLELDGQQEKNNSSNNERGDVSSSDTNRDSERFKDHSTSSRKTKSYEEGVRQNENEEELDQQMKECEDNKHHSIEFQSNLAEHVSENKTGIQTSKYRFQSSRADSFKKKSFKSTQPRFDKTPKQLQLNAPCAQDNQNCQSQHGDKSMIRSLHRMLPHLQTEQNIDQTLEKLLANKHILIVDDTIYNILTLKILLRNAKDLLIEEAYNGRDALEKFQEKAIQNVFFDYIFMDIEMPIMNGLDCIQNIRCFEEANSLRRTIIITVTAYERDLEEILEAGANGLIAKPIQKEKFLQTLRFLSNQNQE